MSQRLKCNFFRRNPEFNYSFSSSDSEDGVAVEPQCKVPRLLSGVRATELRKPAVAFSRRPFTENIIHKLWNREHCGRFNGRVNGKSDELPFKKIPERLRFCLRDIVPYCYLDDHVFMGLTTCGQFLLSYTVLFEEEEEELTQNYSFTNGYKYKLFFWVYRPNTMLEHFYEVCLFDDHGVDNMKTVSIVQWVTNPRVLVVHGASDCENEESYLSYVAVPKLGCLDCSEIRKSESDENCRTDTLCIRCNLTIHSKYTRTDSDLHVVSHVNFNHPDYLVTVSNGFIHALHITLTPPPQQQHQQHRLKTIPSYAYQQLMQYQEATTTSQEQTMDEIELSFGGGEKEATLTLAARQRAILSSTGHDNNTQGLMQAEAYQNHNNNNKTEDATTMVANIIADFAECETKANNSNNSHGKSPEKGRIFFSSSTSSSSVPQVRPSLQKVDSYEFSEETEERCEKISLFRKKRLADKKYEFSEDNSENIIPFNRMRTRSTTMSSLTGGLNSSASPSHATINYFDLHHAHRGSPNYGFRSPCGSPIGNRCLRSPSGGAYYPALSPSHSPAAGCSAGMFSPKHQYHFKRFNSLPPYVFSSPKRSSGDQLQEILPANFQNGTPPPPPLHPLMPPPTQWLVSEGGNNVSSTQVQNSAAAATASGDEKLVFSKKVVRRFVEETDAASVITNEEDDCISPGYHTSLPMEVHGSCYSVMQMISEASAQKLNCAIVRVTQNSFDMDQFTYYVANHNCEKHEKKYGVFYDWACELVSVCTYSGIATCVLAVHFTATDKLPAVAARTTTSVRVAAGKFFGDRCLDAEPPGQQLLKGGGGGGESGDAGNYDCINCSSNLDCVFHRKHYQCCSLFTWDVASGEWTVLDYGELVEMSPKWRNQNTKKQTTILRARAKKMANHLRGGGRSAAEEDLAQKNTTTKRELMPKTTTNELGERNGQDGHLRVLDSCNVKSKNALTDLRNCIEFYRGPLATPGPFADMSDFYEDNTSSEEGEDEEEVEAEVDDD